MKKRLKGVLLSPRLKSTLVFILSLSIIFAPHAVANTQPVGQNVDIEQVTLSSATYNPGQLVPDDQKKQRLHRPKSTVGDGSGQGVPFKKVQQTIKANTAQRRSTAITASQKTNLRTLMGEDDAKVNARVLFNHKNGTPRMIKIQDENVTKRSSQFAEQALSVDAADDFLGSNRELLKIQTPDDEFDLKKLWRDSLGSHHVRYQQKYDGMPVWGREVMIHMDGANQVYMFQGTYEPTPVKAEKIFEIDEQKAIDAAYAHMGIDNQKDGDVKSIERVWYTHPKGGLVASYALKVRPDMMQNWIYFINGKSGEVLHRISLTTNAVMSSSGVDLNGNNQTFNVWQDDQGTIYALDPTIPENDEPHNPVPLTNAGNTYILNANNLKDYEKVTFIKGPEWAPAVASVAHSIKVVDDYWRTTFNRNGIDDKNMNNLLFINVGVDYPNAYWDGVGLSFGEGDGEKFSNLAGSLDIFAHEYTHGIVTHTAGLIYENQPGALNEAFADIFACMVDDDDWTVGEDVTIPAPGYLRSISDPHSSLSPKPAKMSEYQNLPVDQDHGGVHINCTIPARAAYLMAEGLTAENSGTSIGREKTASIFYRALTVYLTQNSQFTDAREATIQAAKDLYGDAEAGSVQAAWDVVEVVGNDDGSNNPSPTDPVSGDDIMVYLRPVDSSGEAFDLYVQQFSNPFQGYDPSSDKGPLNVDASVSYSRPSVYTADDGTVIFYVGTDNNIYGLTLDGEETQITDTGTAHSIALSPNGKYFAFTLEDNTDRKIYVGNLEDGSLAEYELIAPSTAPGDVGIKSTIQYADSLSFDYTSNTLVFDTFNKMVVGNEQDEYTYWSIGTIDLNTGQLYWPFPNQNPNYDIGNASFASNNNYVIALDVIDHSTNPTTSEVWTMDLSTQTIKKVANVNPDQVDLGNGVVFGVPSFWGDDDAITMQIYDYNEGNIAHRVPLQDWAGLPSEAVKLNDNNVAKPYMHRLGSRKLIAEMSSDQNSFSFAGAEGPQEVIITNAGNRDLKIYNIAITGSGESSFRHDGSNGILPRGQQETIQVFFEPSPDAQGTQAANLVIHSDADTPTMDISLLGEAGPTLPGGGGGGGGCFISAVVP